MAGGLAALLDDVAAIAKLTSVAGTKAVGVVVDDTAVTPRYVAGFSPARELPIIWRIAKGSLVNKMIILVFALLASQFVPWILTPILMCGGTYLCFEGAEKVVEALSGHHAKAADTPVVERAPEDEDTMVKGAITTDFILSAEIMVISLAEVASASLLDRTVTLILVAIAITTLVYGVVAVLVKMDDIGLRLMGREARATQRVGKLLVDGMPVIMRILSVVGIAAMLWVGGHILVSGANTLGWHAPHHLIGALSEPVGRIAVAGPALAWLVDTLCSAVVGLLAGLVVVGVMHLIPARKPAADA